jgi:tRNA-dihydrouridine synthase
MRSKGFDLPRPFFILAPMDDVTDIVFRQVIASCAPADLYMTEFLNVDGLQSAGHDKVARRLRLGANEETVIAQLWGLKPENFLRTAQEIVDGTYGRFIGIDLNMGCPEKTVVKSGACAGLIHNPELAVAIIKATQEGAAGKLPVSVKTRLGFSEVDLHWPELLLKQQLAMLTVHCRTRKEMSKVPAHWDDIATIRAARDVISPDTLLVGNGDVISHEQGLELAHRYQLDGIMIGRGIFHDPFIFTESSPWPVYSKKQKLALYAKQVELFARNWPMGTRSVQTLNKFCKVYVNEFNGAKELREQLMAARSTTELMTLLEHEISQT